MSEQWLRRIGIDIEGIEGSSDLSKMRVRFLCQQKTTQSPGAGEFRIYNLSKDTASKIVDRAKGKKLTLTAGYEDNAGVIYKGEIVAAQSGREDPTDTFVDLFTIGGQKAYNRAVVNKTFSAGSRQEDHVEEVLKMMKPFGVTKGRIEGLSNYKYTRAVSLYGMGRDLMRMIAFSNNAHWFINPRDYKLSLLPNNDKGKGGNFKLNANTGLIGMPVQQFDGTIIVTALINPEFDVGRILEIDEKSIQRAHWSVNWGDQAGQLGGRNLSAVTDGTYRIWGIDWLGDTHGTEWYATMKVTGSKTGGMPTSQTGNINENSYDTNHGPIS